MHLAMLEGKSLCTKIPLFVFVFVLMSVFLLPLSPLRVRREPGGAGRAHPAGQFSGLGSSLADQKGKRPTPLPLWVLTGLQQRDKGLSRQNQVPVQDQTTGGCSAGLFWAILIMFMLVQQVCCVRSPADWSRVFYLLILSMFAHEAAVFSTFVTVTFFLFSWHLADVWAGCDRAHRGRSLQVCPVGRKNPVLRQ